MLSVHFHTTWKSEFSEIWFIPLLTCTIVFSLPSAQDEQTMLYKTVADHTFTQHLSMAWDRQFPD